MSIRYTRKQWDDLQEQEKQRRRDLRQKKVKGDSPTTQLRREVPKNRMRFRNKVQMLEYMEVHSIPFSEFEHSSDPKVVEAYERRKGLKDGKKQ